jgi:hypothetical protein
MHKEYNEIYNLLFDDLDNIFIHQNMFLTNLLWIMLYWWTPYISTIIFELFGY